MKRAQCRRVASVVCGWREPSITASGAEEQKGYGVPLDAGRSSVPNGRYRAGGEGVQSTAMQADRELFGGLFHVKPDRRILSGSGADFGHLSDSPPPPRTGQA